MEDTSEAFDEAFVIGDLHADLACAEAWVRRSGLVDLDAAPRRWLGGPRRALVFLGDYVDKGPQGRHVLEFVRGLSDAFPNNTLALLGNHDLYLLFDALHEEGAAQLMGAPVRHFAYAFTHPEEYLNWVPESDRRTNDTQVVLPALFAALDFVYQRGAQGQVMLEGRNNLFQVAPPFKDDAALAKTVMTRLREWHGHMAEGLVRTGLAAWLVERPPIARVGGAVLAHGGLPLALLQGLGSEARRGGLASALRAATSDALRRALGPSSGAGAGAGVVPPRAAGSLDELAGRPGSAELIHEAVTYRGLHGNCREVRAVLKAFSGGGQARADVLVLGHTPGNNVRLSCGGRLAALDSSLSRFFRAHGNLYCPTAHAAAASSGSPCAAAVPRHCAGQAGRLRRPPSAGAWALEPIDLVEWPDAEPARAPAPGGAGAIGGAGAGPTAALPMAALAGAPPALASALAAAAFCVVAACRWGKASDAPSGAAAAPYRRAGAEKVE